MRNHEDQRRSRHHTDESQPDQHAVEFAEKLSRLIEGFQDAQRHAGMASIRQRHAGSQITLVSKFHFVLYRLWALRTAKLMRQSLLLLPIQRAGHQFVVREESNFAGSNAAEIACVSRVDLMP